MRKYWKSVVAVLVIISGIGTYYMQSVISAWSLPDFEIKTIEGDEKLIENLVLFGIYDKSSEIEYNPEKYYEYDPRQYLSITKDGSIYRDSISYLDNLKGTPNTRIRVLRDQYGDFFRGMSFWNDSIYEDEKYLVAAELNYTRNYGRYESLKVKFLNKETKETYTITEKLRLNEHIMIEDVQMNDEEILVFTKSWLFDAENDVHRDFISVYRFNINDKKLISIDELFVNESDLNDLDINLDYTFLVDSKSWSPNDYVVVRKFGINKNVEDVIFEDEDENVNNHNKDERVIEEEVNELYAYNVATHEVKQIILPDTVDHTFVSFIDGKNLYFASEEPNSIKISIYNIHEEKIINEINIDYVKFPLKDGSSLVPSIRIDNGYIYVKEVFVSNNADSTLRVFDAATGDIVYKGEIVSNSKEDFVIEIYNMDFIK